MIGRVVAILINLIGIKFEQRTGQKCPQCYMTYYDVEFKDGRCSHCDARIYEQKYLKCIFGD